MGNESWTSVNIISLDLPAIQRALDQYVAGLSKRPEVLKVVLFGSMATGRYAPGSDVDILVIITHSPTSFRHRIPDYLPRRFPVDMDVFPYTVEEVRRLRFPQEALREGRTLWQRSSDETPTASTPL